MKTSSNSNVKKDLFFSKVYTFNTGSNYGNPDQKNSDFLKQQNLYSPLLDLNEFWNVNSKTVRLPQSRVWGKKSKIGAHKLENMMPEIVNTLHAKRSSI